MRPSQVAESKGRQDKYFKLKQYDFLSWTSFFKKGTVGSSVMGVFKVSYLLQAAIIIAPLGRQKT